MGNALRKLRLRHGLTQEALAEKLTTTKIQVSRWERGWDDLPPPVVKDVAILLSCQATDILGREIPVEEWRESPYSLGDADDLHGALELLLPIGEFRYPFGKKASEKLQSQLSRFEVLGRDESHSWPVTWTLNNRIVFINPRHLIQLNIDEDTSIPHYAHPEVYRAMQDWDGCREEFGPVLRAACEEHLTEVGEEAFEDEYHFRVIFSSGTERRFYMTEWSLGGLFSLELTSFHVDRGSMIEIIDDDGDVRSWINLDHIALIEVPEDEYHRLMAPESVAEDKDSAAANDK